MDGGPQDQADEHSKADVSTSYVYVCKGQQQNKPDDDAPPYVQPHDGIRALPCRFLFPFYYCCYVLAVVVLAIPFACTVLLQREDTSIGT